MAVMLYAPASQAHTQHVCYQGPYTWRRPCWWVLAHAGDHGPAGACARRSWLGAPTCCSPGAVPWASPLPTRHTDRWTMGVLTGGVWHLRPQPLGTRTAAITDMAGTHVVALGIHGHPPPRFRRLLWSALPGKPGPAGPGDP